MRIYEKPKLTIIKLQATDVCTASPASYDHDVDDGVWNLTNLPTEN